MNLIMKKIREISHLKAENRELKKRIEELEQIIKNLEKGRSHSTAGAWGGIGGFGRQK